MTPADLVVFINSTDATPIRKSTFVSRALRESSAYQAPTGSAHDYLKLLSKGELPEVKNFRVAIDFSRAVSALDEKPKIEISDLLSCLKDCWEIVDRMQQNRLSDLRKGIARIDELYFGK